jgi:mono/diheme cytochrome c family protein
MPKLPIFTAVVTGLLLLPVLPTAAEPAASGSVDAQALYEANCTNCHGTEVYTRDDRRIQSLDALHGQVRMCEQNLELTWFDDQIDAVASLLNRKYYKFDE